MLMACFSAFASKYVGPDEDNHSMSTIGRDGCKGGIIKYFIYNLCFDKKNNYIIHNNWKVLLFYDFITIFIVQYIFLFWSIFEIEFLKTSAAKAKAKAGGFQEWSFKKLN